MCILPITTDKRLYSKEVLEVWWPNHLVSRMYWLLGTHAHNL